MTYVHICSEAVNGRRSPHDLANFAEVLGVKSRDCVCEAPYRALQGNLLRRGSPQVVDGDVEMARDELKRASVYFFGIVHIYTHTYISRFFLAAFM